MKALNKLGFILMFLIISYKGFSQLNPQCNNILGQVTAIPSGTLNCNPLSLNPSIELDDLTSVTRCFSYLAQGPINLSFLLVSGQCGPFPLYNNLSYNIYTSNCDTLVASGTIIPIAQAANTYIDILTPNTWYIICYTWTPNCAQSAACPLIYTSLLPIELLYFNAQYDKNLECVMITWATASEKDVDKFIIQKGYDGINFKDEIEIKAKGNSTSKSNYISIDCNESLKNITYYKLIEVDNNGIKYEKSIAVVNVLSLIEEPIEIFNLQGKKLNDFTNGVNIVKQGENYYKVVKLK